MSEILHGKDAPGMWSVGTIGGGGISYRLPQGVSTDTHDAGKNEHVAIVIGIGGDPSTPDAERPVELWVTVYHADRILWNYYDESKIIGTYTGVYTGAENAEEWMNEHAAISEER